MNNRRSFLINSINVNGGGGSSNSYYGYNYISGQNNGYYIIKGIIEINISGTINRITNPVIYINFYNNIGQTQLAENSKYKILIFSESNQSIIASEYNSNNYFNNILNTINNHLSSNYIAGISNYQTASTWYKTVQTISNSMITGYINLY